jgi:hypothetical protein
MQRTDRSKVSRWIVGAAVVGFAAMSVITSAPGAFARSAIDRLPKHPTPMTVTLPHRGLNVPATGADATAPHLKTWHSAITSGGISYPYYMVGKNVKVAQSIPTTTVTAPVIPLIIKIGTHTWDPTVAQSACGETASVVSRVQNSPLFDKTHDFVFGGTDVGTTQYTDAYQRGNFYKFTKPTGVNPGYHVYIKYVAHPAITITVPTSKSGLGTGGCESEGAIEINWFDNYLQTTVFPALAAESTPIGPNKFPIFVMRNVTFFISNTTNCCALGYHNAFNNPNFAGNAQTYSAFEWPDNSFFPASYNDTVVGSHEVAEWMDDPFTDNPTPAWGNIGQVSGCQSNLENGDPLTPTNVPPVTMNGYTYHLQELAFFSWFFRQSPSWGVNGWYSDNGTFTSASAHCP